LTFPLRAETGHPQDINSGVLDANTTLVTLSLGGNDEGAFHNAVTECAGVGSCAADSTFLPRYKAINDRTKTRLAKLLSLIYAKAPNAKIILLSYPELLSRTVKCAGAWYFDMPEAQALAELAGDLATKQREIADILRAAGVQVHRESVINDFVGHGGCDSVEWLHKIRIGARHTVDLAADDVVHLNLDAGHTGLGSSSCGPAVAERHRLLAAPTTLRLVFNRCG
jgi:hypothetical protein